MHVRQDLAGYEDQLPTTKKEKHAAEEALLQHEELAGNLHQKRKGSASKY